MNFVNNDNTDPSGRRRQCHVDIQPLDDLSDDDEELCTIWSNAKPGTLDLPMFTDRFLPGNNRTVVCPVAMKPTLGSSLHCIEREESSNGKHRERYPKVINNRPMFLAHESNVPPKKRHIDFSLEEKLPLKKLALKKRSLDCSLNEKLPLKKKALKERSLDCSVEERLPLKKRRIAKNSITTQEHVNAEQRANNALTVSIHPTTSTSMIPDSFLGKRTLEDDMEDRCLKKAKRSKSVDTYGTVVGHVICSSASFHFG